HFAGKSREVVMSGACVGQLPHRGGSYFGGAAFVTGSGANKIRIPLLSVTEKHGVGAGLAAGVLAREVPGVAPISASASGSVEAGYKLAVFENGKILEVSARAASSGTGALGIAHSCATAGAGASANSE